jgi:acyl-CoA thioesterase-1
MRGLKSLILSVSMMVFMLGCGSDVNIPSKDDPILVACVGDSITEGVGVEDPSVESYPAQLNDLIGDTWDVSNFGHESATAIKEGSVSYWNTNEYVASQQLQPDIVVIMLGTNDMRDVNIENTDLFVEDYSELIESYKALSSAPTVYICLPPPSYDDAYGITNERITEVLIPMLIEVANENNVGVIDVYSALENREDLFPDTLHPNAEGAGIIAQTVYSVIY